MERLLQSAWASLKLTAARRSSFLVAAQSAARLMV